MTIWIGPEAAGIILDSPRRGLAHRHFIPRRRRTARHHQLASPVWRIGWSRLDHLNLWTGEISLHSACSVGFHWDISRVYGSYLVLAEVEARQRNRAFRDPA